MDSKRSSTIHSALFNSPWGAALHTILVVPRLKLIDPVENRFADFYERRPYFHHTPIPKCANGNAATIAFGYFFWCEECGLKEKGPKALSKTSDVARLPGVERSAHPLAARNAAAPGSTPR